MEEEVSDPTAVQQVCGGDGGKPGEGGGSPDSNKGTRTPPGSNGFTRDAKVCILSSKQLQTTHETRLIR